jgi:ISXO2-like transposase domain
MGFGRGQIGIVETDGKVIVKVTNWVNKKTAIDLIDKHVAGGSNMVTDGYVMHAFLGQDDKFKHFMVDHSNDQYVNGGFHTNGIENFCSLLNIAASSFAHIGTDNKYYPDMNVVSIKVLCTMSNYQIESGVL